MIPVISVRIEKITFSYKLVLFYFSEPRPVWLPKKRKKVWARLFLCSPDPVYFFNFNYYRTTVHPVYENCTYTTVSSSGAAVSVFLSRVSIYIVRDAKPGVRQAADISTRLPDESR